MRQSRRHSFTESVVNVAVGFGVSLASQVIIFPLFGVHLRFSDNLLIGFYFTVISIVRSYALRRWFTKRSVSS